MLVCRVGFEPTNRIGTVLQTAALPTELQIQISTRGEVESPTFSVKRR